jgi:hypothetical protein
VKKPLIVFNSYFKLVLLILSDPTLRQFTFGRAGRNRCSSKKEKEIFSNLAVVDAMKNHF